MIQVCHASVGYEDILQWNALYQPQRETLNALQRYQNSSAILHFIELARNFTEEDLDNCKRVSLSSLNYTVSHKAYVQFAHQADIALRTSHFLSNLFSSNFRNNDSLQHLITNKDFYWSLLLANLQSNSLIIGAGITFSNAFAGSLLPNLRNYSPYMYRNVHGNNETVKINLNGMTPRGDKMADEDTFNGDWLLEQLFPDQEFSQWKSSINNYNNLHGPGNKGVWSSPYLDCGLTKNWITTHIVPFFRVEMDSRPSQVTVA